MLGTKSLMAAGLAGLLALTPYQTTADQAPAEQVGPEPVRMWYEVYLSGFLVMTLKAIVRRDEDSYNFRLRATADGAVGWVYNYELNIEAQGVLQDGDYVPISYYTTDNSGGDEERWAEITYNEDGLAVVEAEPEIKERDRLSDEERAGAFDPVSAALILLQSVGTSANCLAEVAVFDGKRRYNLIAEGGSPSEVGENRYSIFSGPAELCSVAIEPVLGFKERDEGRYPEDIAIYLAPLLEGLPPVPVRLEADTGRGDVRVHLVRVQGPVNPQIALGESHD